MTAEPFDPSPHTTKYHRGLHAFAVFMTVWAFLVVFIGGAVKSHEAGLSIAEGFIFHWINRWWEMPNLKWEFLHRVVAGMEGVFALVLVVWTFAVETRPAVRRFSLVLLLAVLVQAVFGWATVRYFAHWPTSIPHAALGQIFLAMMAGMATALSAEWIDGPDAQPETGKHPLRTLAHWNVIAVFVQLLLGAAIRHDDHGKALQHGRDWVFYTHLGAHILGAVSVAYFLSLVLIRIFHAHRSSAKLMNPARSLMVLLAIQVILGMFAAMFKVMYSRDWLDADMPPEIRAWTATAHVAVGALIFALSAVLLARSYRFVGIPGIAAAAPDVPAHAAHGTMDANMLGASA